MAELPTHQFKTLGEVEEYLATHAGVFRSRATRPDAWLARMRKLCAELGNPQEQYRTIHVAGTSGKGSTTTLIASLLVAHGFRVGHTVSPYVESIRERIQLNAQPIPLSRFLVAVSRVADAAESVALTTLGHPSSFELITAASFLVFAEAGVDYAVTETGMGGRYDATNIVERQDKFSVITRIGRDHEEYLGTTLAGIAAQKAAIIQPQTEAVVLAQPTKPVFLKQATAGGARVAFVDATHAQQTASVTPAGTRFRFASSVASADWELGLIGQHQVENAALALTTVARLAERDGWVFRTEAAAHALRITALPGRFTIRSLKGKSVVIDGAHNVQKLSAFLRSLRTVFPGKHPVFVVGFRDGKPAKAMLEQLRQYGGRIITTEFRTTNDLHVRSVPASELATSLGIPSSAISDIRSALLAAAEGDEAVIVVTGSLYLAGAALSALNGMRDYA